MATRSTRVFSGLVMLGLLGLLGCAGSTSNGPRPNTTPTMRLLSSPVPSGVAETSLVVASTEATPGAPPGSSNLVWVVASETREYDYAVANCRHVEVLEAIDEQLARARCDDDEYVVVVGTDQLELRKRGEVALSFTLPRSWRARPLAPNR